MATLRDSELALSADIIYLNHAAVAPWPRRAVEAVQQFAETCGSRGAADYPQWLAVEMRLRQRLARLINARSTDDIALVKNTSEALSMIAYGLDWRSGDNVVVFQGEFPSNRMVWESLSRYGVELREVPLCTEGQPEEDLLARCDQRTRLVSVSSVQYATGFRTDLQTIGDGCRRRKILFCVDAIQSLGALSFDVQGCDADFVAADGHKWMLGPEGLALFWCRPELRERLQLHEIGWHMTDRPGDFEARQWRPSATATRFECGSPNLLAAHALEASLSLIEETGIQKIHEQVVSISGYIMEKARSIRPEVELISPQAEARRSGIVTLRPGDADPETLRRSLLDCGVVCAARGGGLRFSPHFYNEPGEIDAAFDALSRCRTSQPR